MDLIFNPYDYLFLVLIGIGLFFIWKKRWHWLTKGWWYFIWLILFGFILPIVSSLIEVQKHKGSLGDSFNLMYIWLRWPTYWILGLIGMVMIFLYVKARQIDEAESSRQE